MTRNEVEIRDFHKEYGLFRCIQCGRCTGGCPISLKSPFNIRKVVYEALLYEDIKKVQERQREELWECTTCSTCMNRCPKGVNPAELIISMRSILVEDGRLPSNITGALKSVYTQGNPWRMSKDDRSEWAKGLDLDLKATEVVEVLYFVCCTPSYDFRAQKIAKAMAKTFKKAYINFGTLGNEESCCGSEIRRLGDIWMFDVLKEGNLGTFGKYKFDVLVTTSPHCYNAFKNEYDMPYEVKHYTQFVSELIDKKALTFGEKMSEKKVVFHDPCFLGKHNNVFEEPRNILRNIPGVELIEFDRARERSLCCEGGGGRMWSEEVSGRERLAKMRVTEAVELGAQVIATACPFCLITLEDAVKTADLEEKISVMDIIELVGEAI